MHRATIVSELITNNNYKSAAEIGTAIGGTSRSLLANTDLDMFIMVERSLVSGHIEMYDVFRESDKTDSYGITLKPAMLIRSDATNASKYIADGSLDLVFIDANHDYDAVHNDICCWLPKVSARGIICGHDYDLTGNWMGLIQAVYQLIGEVHLVSEAPKGNHVWWQYASVVRALEDE